MARERTLKIQILGDSKSAEQAFGNIEKSAGGLGEKLGTLGKVAGTAMVGVAGAAAIGAGKSVQAFIGFENQMNEVFTLLPGITADAMGAMTDQVLDFSKEFGTLPQDVVPALYNSLSAGVPPDNVFAFLETAQKAAVGGVTDLNTAVDAMSTVVNAFGSDTIDAARASDLMFTAVRLGKTTFDELGGSLSNVAPIAAAMGVEFGDVTAAMAALTAQGVPTSVATTQLRGVMSELGKEGTEVQKVFSEVTGKSFQDFIAGGGNLQTALQALEQHAKDNNLSMVDLFGSIEAGQAALALTGKGTEAFTNAMEEMENAAGATEEAYGQMDNGLQRNIDKIRANFEAMKLQVGQELAPVVARFTGFVLETVIPALGNLASTVQEKAGPALEFLRDVAGRLQDAFSEGGLSGVLGELPGIAAEIGSALLGAIGGIDWAGIGATALSALVAGLKSTTGLVADLAGWLWDAFKSVSWKGIGETAASGLLGGVRNVASFAGDLASWLSDAFTGINWTGVGGSVVDGLLAGINAVTDAGTRVLEWLSAQLSSVEWLQLGTTIVDGLLDGVTAVVDAGERMLGWLTGQLTSVDWSGLGTTVVDGLMGGIEAASDFGERFLSWFQSGIQGGDWGSIGETVSSQISGAMEGLTDLGPVQGLIDLFNTHLLPVFQTIGDEVGGRVSPMIDRFRDSLGQAAENISTNLGPTLENLRGLWESLQPAIGVVLPVLETLAVVVGGVLLAAFNGFLGIMSGVLPNAINAAFAVINGLIQIITGLVETVTGLVNVVKGVLTGDWALAWEGAKQVVSGMVTAITGLFQGLWGAIKGFVMAVVDGVIGLFKGLYHTLVGGSIVPDMINGIIEWFLKLPGEVVGIISGFVGSAIGFFGDLAVDGAAKAGELIGGVLSEVGRLMSEGVEKVSGFVHSALGFLGDLVSDGATKAGEFLTGVMDALLDLFIDGPKRIWEFVKAGIEEIAKLAVRGAEEAGKLPGAVLEAIGDLSTTLLQAGKDIVQGLIDGIGSKLGDLASAAGGVVTTITDNIKDPLGIFSPSRLMHEYGVNIGEGLVEGMESKLGDIFDAASELSSAILTGATRDLDRVPELVGAMTDEVAVTLANSRSDLQGQLDLAILRGDDEETLQGYRDQIAAIDALLLAWAEATGQTVQGVLENVAADVAASALPSPEEIVAEWDQRLGDALAGPAFGENIQAGIDSLDQKITLGKLMGAPQDVIDAWEAQKADLTKQAGFYWYDVAQAAAAGLIDKKALKEFAKAGGEQFEMYLDSLVGTKARKEMLEETGALSAQAVKEMKKIFAVAPELAADFIDDIVQGMNDGAIPIADGMAMLAGIPQDQLIPALVDMSDTYQKQIVEAILAGNMELAYSLRETKAEVDALANSMTEGGRSARAYVAEVRAANSVAGGGGSSPNGVGATGEPIPQGSNITQIAPGQWVSGPIQNTVNVNVDGEPVAQAVNRVNSNALPTNVGPI